MTDTELELPSFPMARCPFDPPPEYAEMRADSPATKVRLYDGSEAWVVPRYEDVRRLLVDPRISSDRTKPGYPFLTEDAKYLSTVKVFVGMDPPEHGPHRRAFIPHFTAKKIKALRPVIEKCVDECLAAMAQGPKPADLLRSLALPVPTMAIAKIFGVPDEDFAEFAGLISALSTDQQTQEQFAALITFIRKLVRSKIENPTDDMLGRVADEHVNNGDMTVHELVMITILLLFAGYETTANMISMGILTLWQNPEQLEQVKADPTLIPEAVEELLRYLTVAELATGRTTTADFDLGEGVVIPAGDGIIPLGAAANRDSAAFPDADKFDIHRADKHHVAFGYGPHACIGANLARLELEVVFTALFRDFPDLRLGVPFETLRFKTGASLYGVHALPVTW